MPALPVTAIIPSTGSRACLHTTLARLQQCEPSPAQVIVHLDDPPSGVVEALHGAFPEVQVLVSGDRLGPGGGRGRLIQASAHDLVASFDDDSYPDTPDYFARVWSTAELFPDAAVISAASPGVERLTPGFMRIAVYSGCGCVFRRSWLLRVAGFVPLPVAYGMEEVDVSLQLHAAGGVIVHDPQLQIRHDHPPGEPRDISRFNALLLANALLLPFLRYPAWLFPIGLAQWFNRMLWMIRSGNQQGLLRGIGMFPGYSWKYRKFRRVVSAGKLAEWLELRHHPQLLAAPGL